MNIVVEPVMPTPVPLPKFSLADIQGFLVLAQKVLVSVGSIMVAVPALAAFVPVINVLNMIISMFITDPQKQHELMTAISAFV